MDPGELPPSQVDKGFMREGVDATSGKRKIDTLTATDNAKAQRLQAKVKRIATMQRGWESWQQWAEVGTPGTWGKELNRPPPIQPQGTDWVALIANAPGIAEPPSRWRGQNSAVMGGWSGSTDRQWFSPSSWRTPPPRRWPWQ